MTFPSFTTGEVLTAADMNAVGLWLVKTQTVGTAVSSVQVTGAFSNTYDNYFITLTGGTGSATAVLRVQLGSTATGYYNAGNSIPYTGAAVLDQNNNGTLWTTCGIQRTDFQQLQLFLFCPNRAQKTFMSATYTDTANMVALGGYLNGNDQHTAFTISPATGTMTGGTIRVYGYRN
jgi:hypothetical protein